MGLSCPTCGSITTELRECDKCGNIGCHKCMKKLRNDWVCFNCEVKKDEIKPTEDNAISNFLSNMFG